jgi:hypothetical protein
MFVELIESLRCPNEHEPSALVVAATNVVARHIVDGTLGCPVCGAQFVIAGGVARFGEAPAIPPAEPSDAEAMRLAAFLELTDAKGFAFLCGRWSVQAERLLRLTETPVVLVNPAGNAPANVAAGVIVTAQAIPFADGAARAAALDESVSDALRLEAVRAVRTGGRVLGPATTSVPDGVREIARDGSVWVGEKETAAGTDRPRLVRLARAKS